MQQQGTKFGRELWLKQILVLAFAMNGGMNASTSPCTVVNIDLVPCLALW